MRPSVAATAGVRSALPASLFSPRRVAAALLVAAAAVLALTVQLGAPVAGAAWLVFGATAGFAVSGSV